MTRKKRNSRRNSNEALLTVFTRLPTRDAERCSVLSRHHRRLVASLDFWLKHRRLVPAVPRPRIAYMATSILPGRLFHEFHVAGGGGDLMRLRRPLIDREPHYFGNRQCYAGTCNGVVALAPGTFYSNTTVVFFHPAVLTGGEAVVGIEIVTDDGQHLRHGLHRVSGFGYGTSSRRHKLLLAKLAEYRVNNDDEGYDATELLAYTFGRASPDQPRCRKVLTCPGGIKITGSPVYLDGKIYLLADHSRVLVFDVDKDTVTDIELPGERQARSELMEMSGRLCVATAGGEGSGIDVWLLTADQQQWEQRCMFSRYADDKLAGAWDCGGMLLLFFEGLRKTKEPDVILYDTRTKGSEPLQLHVPRVVADAEQRRSTAHVFCWGYRPTLVSPAIINGGGGPPPRQRGGGGVIAALNPVLERDVKMGRERTLDTVCFMDLLDYIMRQLPHKSNDVIRECSRSSLPFSLR